jgi:hypothetical protein
MKTMDEIRGDKKEADRQNYYNSSSNRTFQWPNVEVALSASWVEEKGKSTCGYTGKVSVKGNPLLGITLQWDITHTILTYLTGGAILGIEELLEQINLEVLKILLKIGGIAQGEVTAHITKNDVSFDGNLKVLIPFSIEATAFRFEKKVWIFKASIEIGLILETGVEFYLVYKKEVRTFSLGGKFNDIVFSYVGKFEIGGAKEEPKENKYKPPKPGTTTEKESSLTDKGEGKHVIYEKKFEKPFLEKDIPLNNSKT